MGAATYTSSRCVESASAFATCLSNVVINPILALLFAVALLVFVWGVVQFIWGLSSEASHKEEGRMHMLWGLIGMFIMVAAYAILHLVANTINVPLPH
jgi:hypothetical protein